MADGILGDLLDPDTGRRLYQVFLDDVVIYSVTWAQHMASIRAVLTRLFENGLKIFMSKCSWGQSSCKFPGYELREGRTLPSPRLVKAIDDFPWPSTVKQALSYLGTCNFFRNYIPRFAHTAAPLYDLTRKRKGNATIEDLWTPVHDISFLDVKRR